MRINGLQKLTLLDFPGRTACTVFTGGCNFRCPFCHNASLVLREAEQPVLDEEEIFAFLEKRRGLLDGVAVTGGEPLLQRDLAAFLRRVKALGYAVKLDTNGSDPAGLKALLDEGLVDCVAMDIKTCRENYAAVCGVPGFDTAPVEASAALLLAGSLPYEFRTTVVRELHSPADFERIGRWLAGAEEYYLQTFRDSGDLVRPGLTACTRDEMERMRAAAAPWIPHTALRGAD